MGWFGGGVNVDATLNACRLYYNRILREGRGMPNAEDVKNKREIEKIRQVAQLGMLLASELEDLDKELKRAGGKWPSDWQH